MGEAIESSSKMKTFLSAFAVLILQAGAHNYGYQGLNEVFERGPAVKAVVDDYGYESLYDTDVLEYNRHALADETNVIGYVEPLVARKVAVHHEPVASYREVAVHKEPVQFVAAHPVRYEAAVHREPVHYEAAVHREVGVTEPAPIYAPAARYERIVVDSPAHREVAVMAARPLMHKKSAPLVVEAVKPVVLKKAVHVEPMMHRNNYVARGLQYGENGPFASSGLYSQGVGHSTRPLFRIGGGFSGNVGMKNLKH